MKKKELTDFKGEYRTLSVTVDNESELEDLAPRVQDYHNELDQLGVAWLHGDDSEEELIEEHRARAENSNQRQLVAFFNGSEPPSDRVLEVFQSEMRADEPNDPLFRRFFRSRNDNLKCLLEYGLLKYPTDPNLLYDFGYFHQFQNCLNDVVGHYMHACSLEMDLPSFEILARDFHEITLDDGFEALQEMRQRFLDNDDKRRIIERLIDVLGD